MNEFGRSAQEQREYEKPFYPGTQILKNKLNIRDPEKLDQAERYFARMALQDGLPEEAKVFTVAGLKAIHRTLLNEVYSWAGEFRKYTTGRGSAPFAVPEHIGPSLEKMLAKLKSENGLKGLAPAPFAARAAIFVNEVNAAHPFIDGNGRTQRVWLRNLGEQAGHIIALQPGDKDRWNAASKEGFYRSDDPMAKLIEQRLVSGRVQGRSSLQQQRVDSLLDNYKERRPDNTPTKTNDRDNDQER